MAEEKNVELSKRVIERYANYAEFIGAYSSEEKLRLSERQISLLERAICDELSGEKVAFDKPQVQHQDPYDVLLNESVDLDYMRKLASQALVTRMLNVLIYSDSSPIKGEVKNLSGLNNRHLLKVYEVGRQTLLVLPDFTEKSYNLLQEYITEKHIAPSSQL